MLHLFQSPIRERMEAAFSVQTFRTLPSNPRPALTIRWKDAEGRETKKSLLMEDLDILEEYILEMVHKHTLAYMELLNFSQKNLSAKYPFVHRIINDCSYSH